MQAAVGGWLMVVLVSYDEQKWEQTKTLQASEQVDGIIRTHMDCGESTDRVVARLARLARLDASLA